MERKETPSKEKAAETIRFFWSYAKKFPKDLSISLILIPINVTLISTVIPWLISRILDTLSKPSTGQSLTPYVVGILASAVLGLVVNFIGFRSHFKHLTETYAALVQRCFYALSERGEHFYANKFTGALTKYAVDFPNAFSSIEGAFIINVLPFITRALTGVVVVYLGGAPWLALLLLLFSFGTVYIVYRGRARRQTLRDVRRNAQTAINSHLADVITNNQTMRTFAQWDTERKRNSKLTRKWATLMHRDFALVNWLSSQLIQLSLAMQILFVLIMIYFVRSGSISISVAIFSITYLIRFATELFGIGGMMNQIENALIDAAPMMTILHEAPEVNDAPRATQLLVDKAEINFTEVDFAYQENAGQNVLSHLDLHIKPGEKIGLVGPSGGGKSTITKILLRLLDIQAGNITIDGQDVSLVTQESLRKNISYVPQESILFHRTLAENISYGNPSANLKDVVRAAKLAHADEFIQKLPEGYDTLVGERGVKLSGGQRQRVAIARAILKNAPILVLDEATSSLDSESEKLIQDALAKLMENRTAIVIAHRLSTIQKMDRIIVLEKGALVETGTHQELLKKSGLYARLWAHQSGGFLED